MSAPHNQPAPRLALDVPDKYYAMTYHDNSPLSSPQSADDSDPINSSEPMNAPHNQLRYPSNQRDPSSSFHPTPDSAIDHRRMSEPSLFSGSHPSAYRPLDSRYNYASSSAYSPLNLHYPVSSRPAYAVHSRTDNNASTTDYQSQQTHDDAFSDPSNNSPRPSAGSTGAVDSNVHVRSLSPHSSVSPDTSTQPLSKDKNPSSPPNKIERLYHCSWPDCTKAYGTLNHLNAHVVMQKHGPKRLPSGEHRLDLIFIPENSDNPARSVQSSESCENNGARPRRRVLRRRPPPVNLHSTRPAILPSRSTPTISLPLSCKTQCPIAGGGCPTRVSQK